MTASQTSLPDGAIDIHAHILVPEVHKFCRPHSLPTLPLKDPSLTEEQRAKALERHNRMVDTQYDVDERIERMDTAGVGMQILTVSTVHQTHDWASPEQIEQFEHTSNAWMRDMVARHPTRYRGMGGVPMHDTKKAVAEVERCMGELGLSGIQIASFDGGREIGDPVLHPFWAKCQEMSAVVYMHPRGNRGERFLRNYIWNSIGQSFEESMALASLMYEGVLDKYPDLRICICHGGGYFPYNLGRINRNYREKLGQASALPKTPIEFLRGLWYDTCVYDEDVLQRLVEIVGPDRIIMGSDYPVGNPDPVGFVKACKFDADTERKILRDNAIDLFQL